MEAGHGAYLLDEERPDVFQASVGNLPPGKEVLLKITYVTELTVDTGALRFVIPTTVSPRYAPQVDRAAVGRPDAEALNPPLAWHVPYGLELSARIAMPGGAARIDSPSHPIALATDDSAMVVTLAQREVALDRDFVLNVSAPVFDRPQAWLERSDDGREAIAVAFVPKIEVAVAPAEVIFVIDRSGSMGGTSIEEVRNAMQMCLRSLIDGCRFNIVGFGSTYDALFPESQQYDERSLTAASNHAASLEADLGGTEVLPALEYVLRQPRSERPRQVVILTDGQVTNTDAVLALVRSHAADTRVFAFGIGAGSSRHLVEGIARAGGGSAEFIAPGERIEPKVVRLVNRLLTPAFTDARLDWGGLQVTAAPSRIPPVFSGERLVVYGFVERLQPATLRLSGTVPSGPMTFEVPLDPQSAVPGTVISTLAARARIRELEESPEWLSARGSRQQRARATDSSREIIDLAVRYSLISRETSFVAVERRQTPVQGDVQLRRIPIALTNGWGGLDRRMDQATKPGMAARPPAAALRSIAHSPMSAVHGIVSTIADMIPGRHGTESEERLADLVEPARHGASGRTRARKSDDADRARMLAVVSLQRADGSWELDEPFARAIGQPLDKLRVAQPSASGTADDASRAWATALALQWLTSNAAASGDEWRIVAMKARQWLDRTLARSVSGRSWSDEAARLLRPPS